MPPTTGPSWLHPTVRKIGHPADPHHTHHYLTRLSFQRGPVVHRDRDFLRAPGHHQTSRTERTPALWQSNFETTTSSGLIRAWEGKAQFLPLSSKNCNLDAIKGFSPQKRRGHRLPAGGPQWRSRFDCRFRRCAPGFRASFLQGSAKACLSSAAPPSTLSHRTLLSHPIRSCLLSRFGFALFSPF